MRLWGSTVSKPFGAVYRYENYDSELALNRDSAREMLRNLRRWVEESLRRQT
jgi:hypothetical protein